MISQSEIFKVIVSLIGARFLRSPDFDIIKEPHYKFADSLLKEKRIHSLLVYALAIVDEENYINSSPYLNSLEKEISELKKKNYTPEEIVDFFDSKVNHLNAS